MKIETGFVALLFPFTLSFQSTAAKLKYSCNGKAEYNVYRDDMFTDACPFNGPAWCDSKSRICLFWLASAANVKEFPVGTQIDSV